MQIYSFLLASALVATGISTAQASQETSEEKLEAPLALQGKQPPTQPADIRRKEELPEPQDAEGRPGRQSNPPIEGKLFPAPGTAASTD